MYVSCMMYESLIYYVLKFLMYVYLWEVMYYTLYACMLLGRQVLLLNIEYTHRYLIGICSLTPTSPVLISWGIRLSNNLSWDGLTHRVMQASGLSGHVATVT